jgi:putative flippase GtrA
MRQRGVPPRLTRCRENQSSAELPGTNGLGLLRYSIVGASASALHWIGLALLVELAGSASAPASAFGALLGAGVAYAGNRSLTFRGATVSHRVALPRFLNVAAAGAVANAGIVYLGTSAGWHYLAAQAVGTLTVLLVGYGVNQRWTFR